MVAPYGGMGDKRYERAIPQSTALTAPLKGSYAEYVVCRKPLLEEMGPLAVEAWSYVTNSTLYLLKTVFLRMFLLMKIYSIKNVI